MGGEGVDLIFNNSKLNYAGTLMYIMYMCMR